MLIDTHAHLHFAESFPDLGQTLLRAAEAGVTHIINVGVDPADSIAALKLSRNKHFGSTQTGVALYATAGLHPHEAGQGDRALDEIFDMAEDVIAIGECGLDYFKNHASKEDQEHVLRGQFDIAIEHNLPLIFHVRDAWEDFFRILADYPKARGVIHSFTGGSDEVRKALAHQGDLYFGLNGIMTFTKEQPQLDAAKLIPRDRLLLETDCPFLAPTPYRGKRNESGYVADVAQFLASLRGEPTEELCGFTSANAIELFDLS